MTTAVIMALSGGFTTLIKSIAMATDCNGQMFRELEFFKLIK